MKFGDIIAAENSNIENSGHLPAELEILRLVTESYYRQVCNLHDTWEKSEGAARGASGQLFETLTDRIILIANEKLGTQSSGVLKGKIGTDDFQTVSIGALSRTNLQVDRHLYKVIKSKENIFAFLECKTYLDVPYLLRAVFNFYELTESIKQREIDHENLRYIIIAGQDACSATNIDYYRERFKQLTGCELHIFFLSRTKKRTSAKPLFTYLYPLDYDEVLRLYSLITMPFLKD